MPGMPEMPGMETVLEFSLESFRALLIPTDLDSPYSALSHFHRKIL